MASPESQSVAVMMPSLQLRRAGDDGGLVRVHGCGDGMEGSLCGRRGRGQCNATSEQARRAVFRGAYPSRMLVAASRRDELYDSLANGEDDLPRWPVPSEVRFGGTPKPTRGTRVLPGSSGAASSARSDRLSARRCGRAWPGGARGLSTGEGWVGERCRRRRRRR